MIICAKARDPRAPEGRCVGIEMMLQWWKKERQSGLGGRRQEIRVINTLTFNFVYMRITSKRISKNRYLLQDIRTSQGQGGASSLPVGKGYC
jgi:hypothetical protein